MIKPDELGTEAGQLTWATMVAAAEGNVIALRGLLARDPRLGLSEYWYTPAIQFAVREGHVEAVQLLLDAGAHPEWNGLHDGSLIRMASERGYTEIARRLEHARDRRGIIPTTLLHLVCNGPDTTGGNVERAAMLLDAGATIAPRDDEYRSTPLAWAARTNAASMVEFLLARGAPTNLPDDEPWATPLAWAVRRGHSQVASTLRAHGAVR